MANSKVLSTKDQIEYEELSLEAKIEGFFQYLYKKLPVDDILEEIPNYQVVFYELFEKKGI